MPDFADFWNAAYPRRGGRQQALRAWRKLSPAAQEQAIIGARKWVAYWEEQGVAHQYRPHASTFLNQRRFEEPPPPVDRICGNCEGKHAGEGRFCKRCEASLPWHLREAR